MATTPVAVEAWRGGRVESRHRVRACVVDAAGGVVLAVGDVDEPVFPRSAVKPFQALALVETGAAERVRRRATPSWPWPAPRTAASPSTWRWSRPGCAGWASRTALACGPHPPSTAPPRPPCSAAAPPRGGCTTTARASTPACWRRRCTWGADPRLRAGRTIRCSATSPRPSPELAGLDGCPSPASTAAACPITAAAARPGPCRGGARRPERAGAGAAGGAGADRRGHARPPVTRRRHRPLLHGRDAGGARRDRQDRGRGRLSGRGPGRGLGIAVKAEDGATRAAEVASWPCSTIWARSTTRAPALAAVPGPRLRNFAGPRSAESPGAGLARRMIRPGPAGRWRGA